VLPFALRFEPLAAGKTVAIADVEVTPYRTTHLDSLKKHFQAKYPGEYAAYCFQIVAGKRRVAHSADIGTPEDLDPLLKQPVDLLVCELAHFEPEELFGYLKNKKIGQMLFTHLSRWNWERLPEIEEMAAEMLPNTNHTFARDQHMMTL
jgi:ribonuclease BN (tRNA processing enzyme)